MASHMKTRRGPDVGRHVHHYSKTNHSCHIKHFNFNTIHTYADSPEISSPLISVRFERESFNKSVDDLIHDMKWNSVCACVHPERLVNRHLFNDGVKLCTVADLLTHLFKVILDAYPSNIGASGGR